MIEETGILAKLAQNFENLKPEKAIWEKYAGLFGKIDTEDQRELAGGFGITSIPTLAAFREGIMVFSQPGALPAPALEQVITAVKGLDMDDVRRQIAEQQPGDALGSLRLGRQRDEDERERRKPWGSHQSCCQCVV